MVKVMNRQEQEEYVNDFIDSLIMECSPAAPSSMNQEMADLLETVRGVKRLRSDKELLDEMLTNGDVSQRRRVAARRKPWMKWTSAAAALFLLVGVVSLIQRMPQLTQAPDSAPFMMRSAQPADAPEEPLSMAAAGADEAEEDDPVDGTEEMMGAAIAPEESGQLEPESASVRESDAEPEPGAMPKTTALQDEPAAIVESPVATGENGTSEETEPSEVGIRMMPPSEDAADPEEEQVTMFSLEAPLGQQATAVMVRQTDDLYVELRLLDLAVPYQEFRLSDSASQQFQDLKPEQGQLFLVIIEAEEGEIPLVTMLMPVDYAVLQARYLGRIDNRFAEFDINGRLIVMALSQEMQQVFGEWDESMDAGASEQQVQLVIEAVSDGAAGLVIGAEKIGE
ncbi:hypothetical protein [Anoxynatronum buryatiense]|uniref:Uncharacterized protein n=1 Tax=Anoxynatronum buryatiense TaxID=489973 RepID=A0AA45WX95_9CLOT|nr:hypothetical protein [Anoxynatronum buryatiense]SMP62667.1 hypothetical protein SAMN06296020_11049 [Anoxynatronum buryatiense]